jgi:general secretion pathway protein C
MQYPINFTSLIETFHHLPQQKIAKGLSAILFVYLAYLLAQITWLVMPEGDYKVSHSVNSKLTNKQQEKSALSMTSLKSLNLFGLYTDKPEEIKTLDVTDAPETRLNLTLAGVVASDEKSTSAAVIENNGKQETYSPGETITGTRAVLDSVFNDRVIIKHAGRLETLMLDGFKFGDTQLAAKPIKKKKDKTQSRTKFPSSPNFVDQRANKALSENARLLKNDINSDPSKITDYLKISPKRIGGKVIGYRLMPGGNPEFFKSAGLKNGDVAIQMNGYDLSIPTEAARAIGALKEEKEVSLLLDRNGEITEILFSIDE